MIASAWKRHIDAHIVYTDRATYLNGWFDDWTADSQKPDPPYASLGGLVIFTIDMPGYEVILEMRFATDPTHKYCGYLRAICSPSIKRYKKI